MAAPANFANVLTNCGFSAAVMEVLTDPLWENLTLDEISAWEDDDVEQIALILRKVQAMDADGKPTGNSLYVKSNALENLKTVAYAARHAIHCHVKNAWVYSFGIILL